MRRLHLEHVICLAGRVAEKASPSRGADDGPSTSCPSAHIQSKNTQQANDTASGGTHAQTTNRTADGAQAWVGTGKSWKGTPGRERSAEEIFSLVRAASIEDGARMVVMNAERVGFDRVRACP
jgi:hypothetical protein